jgi:hypothetical protein
MSAAHKSALAVRAATGVEGRIFDVRDCTGVSASAAMSAVVLLPHGLLGSLVALVLIIFGRTQNDLAYAGTVGGIGNAWRITLKPSPDWCGNAAPIGSQKSSCLSYHPR